jgi:hypothetical protein
LRLPAANCVPHQVIDGREYIRAFGQGAAAREHAIALIEGSTRAQFFSIGLQRWLALQLEIIGALMLLCVALTTVASRSHAGADYPSDCL